jgi:hypothetical protein
MQSIHRGLGTRVQQVVKLLSPQPYAVRTLQEAGLI